MTNIERWLTHWFYLVILAVVVIAGRFWISEHDARLRSEMQVVSSTATVKSLQGKLQSLQMQASVKVRAIAARVQKAHTTPEIVAAIPSLSDSPLNVRTIPAMPAAVAVDAAPLLQELAYCSENEINLNACQKEREVDQAIMVEDRKEIAALKKEPSFLHRLGHSIKTGAIFVSIGLLIGRLAL